MNIEYKKIINLLRDIILLFLFFVIVHIAILPFFFPVKADANVTVGGYVRDLNGGGIPGVIVRVKNSNECASCGTTAVTDNNGYWEVPDKTPDGQDYAVRFDYPAPPGYTGPALTTTTVCSYQTCCGTDTPFHSGSYETQPANGCGCAASYGGVSYRCNFEYVSAPTPTPSPTSTPLPTPTSIPTPTSTPVPTSTPTSIPSPTSTPNPTATPAPSATPLPTQPPLSTVFPGITLYISQPPNTIMGRIDLSNIVQFIFNLLVAIGIIAALSYLMYGAIKWTTSGGDKAAVEAAKNHVTHAVIGLMILVLSWVIVSLIFLILGIGTIPSSVTLPRLG